MNICVRTRGFVCDFRLAVLLKFLNRVTPISGEDLGIRLDNPLSRSALPSISIHANSSHNREARGVETYSLSLATSQDSAELAMRENALAQSSLRDLPELIKKITRKEMIGASRQLAVDIQNALSQALQLVSTSEMNRGVKQAPFVVLTGANMPAVLSEISFASNASDENLLLESSQRQRIAEGLYRGIAAYLDSLHSPPDNKWKLVSENGVSTASGFATSRAAIERDSR
jgi:N-acetylmuramoyl-L-alanine amidase